MNIRGATYPPKSRSTPSLMSVGISVCTRFPAASAIPRRSNSSAAALTRSLAACKCGSAFGRVSFVLCVVGTTSLLYSSREDEAIDTFPAEAPKAQGTSKATPVFGKASKAGANPCRGSGQDKYNSAWMMRDRTGRRELEVNLGRESRELRSHEIRPPNYPPREVLLVLRLNACATVSWLRDARVGGPKRFCVECTPKHAT